MLPWKALRMSSQPLNEPRRRLASLDAAGEYASVSRWTIRRRIADGTITGFRLGRLIRVDLTEVDDAMLRRIPTAGDAS